MTPLMVRLDREIQLTTDPAARARLELQLACALARFGDANAASDVVGRTRQAFSDYRSPVVLVWILIAEAVIYRYAEEPAKALDKLTRAQAVSLAMNYDEGAALSSAWKASVEFDLSAWQPCFESLRIARVRAAEHDHDAQQRVALILLSAFTLLGDAAAQKWFVAARQHADVLGDRTAVEALQYNRAAFTVARLRAAWSLGEPIESDLMRARREVVSSHALRQLTGVRAFESHAAICESRISLLERRYDEALAAMDTVSAGVRFGAASTSDYVEHVERAFCLSNLGRNDEAAASMGLRSKDCFLELDIDDRLACTHMELLLAEAGVGGHEIDLRRQELELHRSEFRNSKEALATMLAPYA